MHPGIVIVPVRLNRPSYLHSRPADFHTGCLLSFFCDAISFSISKVLSTRRGSMWARGTITTKRKLNQLSRYFPDLTQGSSLAKDLTV